MTEMKMTQRVQRTVRSVPETFALWWRRVLGDWRTAGFDERLAGLVALTLPFERTPAVEAAGFTVRLSMVFGVLLIFRTALAIIRRRQSLLTGWPERLLLIFGLWNILYLPFVFDPRAALQVVVPTVYVILLAVSIGRMVRPQKLPLLAALVCAGGLVASLFGIYQFIGDFAGLPHWLTAMRDEYSWQRFGFPRVLSTALEPLFFSAYLLLPLSLVLAYFGHNQSHARKAALLGIAILYIGVDVLTVSRGGILALAMLLFMTAILIAFSGRRRAAAVYVGRLGVVVAVSLIIGLGFLSVFNRPGQDSDVTYGSRGISTFVKHLMNTRLKPNQDNLAKEDSLAQRSSVRDYSVDVITGSPHRFMVGVGPGQYQAYNLRTAGRPDIVVANVLPVDIMLHTGFVGLALVGAALLLIFMKLLKLARRQHVIAGALVAYFLALGLQSLTFPTLYITHLWFAVGLALVATTGAAAATAAAKKPTKR